MAGPAPTLSVRNLGKSYAAPVLEAVDLDLRPGEVLALVGENGAGKSTLAKIIAGLVTPTFGTLQLDGTAYRPAGRADAERAGVRIVLQELGLIPTLTVAENLFLAHLPHRWGAIHWPRLRAMAREAMARIGLNDVSPDALVGELGIGRQQMIEIARNLTAPCRVLLFDEPTAMLTAREVELLFTQVRRLKAEGVAIVFVSHRLEELAVIADRVTVLRAGRLVATGPMSQFASADLVRLMAGREVSPGRAAKAPTLGATALRVQNLGRARAVSGVSLEVRRGEILGLAGLVGSGRTELLRLIFGADRADEGEIWLGEPLRRREIQSPREAVAAGVAFVTEDRKEEGLLLELPVTANVSLGNLARVSNRQIGIRTVDRRAESTLAGKYVQALSIRCATTSQPVGELSGGNQQKVVLARWLERDAEVYLLDEPSRGVDPAARADIHRQIDELAGRGKAVVVVSSDLRELMELCDRIAVMSEGQLVETFARADWSADAILAAAFRREAKEGAA